MPDESFLRLLLSIASFAIAAGGLVQTYFFENKTKTRGKLLATAFTFLVVLSGIAVYNRLEYRENVRETSRNIISVLRQEKNLTADQIYMRIFPHVEESILTEALESLAEDGPVHHRFEEFVLRDGSVIATRIYSLNGR